jgi:hypothetical protein
VPQTGQTTASGCPQAPQNFLPAGFSVPQFEQTMRPSLTRREKGTDSRAMWESVSAPGGLGRVGHDGGVACLIVR